MSTNLKEMSTKKKLVILLLIAVLVGLSIYLIVSLTNKNNTPADVYEICSEVAEDANVKNSDNNFFVIKEYYKLLDISDTNKTQLANLTNIIHEGNNLISIASSYIYLEYKDGFNADIKTLTNSKNDYLKLVNDFSTYLDNSFYVYINGETKNSFTDNEYFTQIEIYLNNIAESSMAFSQNLTDFFVKYTKQSTSFNNYNLTLAKFVSTLLSLQIQDYKDKNYASNANGITVIDSIISVINDNYEVAYFSDYQNIDKALLLCTIDNAKSIASQISNPTQEANITATFVMQKLVELVGGAE